MKNRTTNKILSFVLVRAFTMLFALSPGLVSAQITSHISVGSTTGDTSGEGWSWNQSEMTLTLNNLDMYITGTFDGIYLYIYPSSVTIELNGTNSIVNAMAGGTTTGGCGRQGFCTV